MRSYGLCSQPITVNVLSSRANTIATGSIQVKLGFVRPKSVNHGMDFGEIYSEILRRAKKADMTIVSAPPVSFSSRLIHSSRLYVRSGLDEYLRRPLQHLLLRITIFNFWERI